MADKNEKLKAFETSIRHRVQCEEKAFHTVNRLIDGSVDGHFLIECGHLLSKEDYESVAEERAISSMCGYPVCANDLKNVPNKKYQICTRTNKVYDISDRKNFCSNKCFQASKHFLNQIPESPVWMRQRRKQSEITLLPLDKARGLVGEQVVGESPTKALESEVQALKVLEEKLPDRPQRTDRGKQRTQRTSVNDEKKKRDSQGTESVKETQSKDSHDMLQSDNAFPSKRQDELEKAISQMDNLSVVDHGCETSVKTDQLSEKASKTPRVDKPQVVEYYNPGLSIRESLLRDGLGNLTLAEKTPVEADPARSSSISCSLNTDTVEPSERKSNLKENSPVSSGPSSSKMDHLKALMAKRKGKLSCMVDVQEKANTKVVAEKVSLSKGVGRASENNTEPEPSCAASDKNMDKMNTATSAEKGGLGQNQSSDKEMPPQQSVLDQIAGMIKPWVTDTTIKYLRSPLSSSSSGTVGKISDPHIQRGYMELCQRVSMKEAEVETLFTEVSEEVQEKGEESVRPGKGIPVYEMLKEEAEDFQLKVSEFITGKPKQVNKKKEEEEDTPIYFPTVDKYDQAQIRAKIVMDRLDKALSELLLPLKLTTQDIATGIRELVYTFKLERDNITFRPSEWTLVAIFVLKMLALKDQKISSVFAKDSSSRFFSILFKGIGCSMNDVDVLLRKVLTVDTSSDDVLRLD